MGKYEPLSELLRGRSGETWVARFSEIEKAIGCALPPSARTYREWWANQRGGGHSQAKGWQDAGWKVWKVDLEEQTVTFQRARKTDSAVASDRTEALIEQAARLTGTHDRARLIEDALQALLEREATRHLIAMGGAAPNYQAPPRERPLV